MNQSLSQRQNQSLLDDHKTCRKLELNYRRNQQQDNTRNLDALAAKFRYEDCQNVRWNPENFSLLYGTKLWHEATATQRTKLNQLYWVAYYSQIISAEIATIFFNQTSAAGLYALEDFRLVCDTLDLESAQERAHINVFKKISEDFEQAVFGERLFTYAMRGPFVETMIHHHSNRVKKFWRWLQLHAFTLLSSGNAFIGCQYFTVRGVRTLNGKLIQHQLSRFYAKSEDQANAAIPSQVSYCHFLDESFHFNSSTVISHDVLQSVKAPTQFERFVANRALRGTQQDHYHFSTAINGLFWYDPALFAKVYKILRSPIFQMSDQEARQMMTECFTKDSDGLQLSAQSRQIALESYCEYLSALDYVSRDNKAMAIMRRNSIARHLATNRRELRKFFLALDAGQ
ncbi:MAG: P-aminobenzoate N-oxygenase AurF [Acidobacteria bacterium]|nr:P-aminobenzoate N-oxygenase AurF [Acidobacteriota bacterium]